MIIAAVFYIIWILNLVLVLLRKKSKVVVGCSFALIPFFYYFCRTADYVAYEQNYYVRGANTVVPDVGFKFIEFVFRDIFHLQFSAFLTLLSIISLLVIFYIYQKYTNNYHLFFSIYYLYQFFIDVIQIRNYFAGIILFIAFYFSLCYKKKISIALCVISASFHITMLFYVPLFILWDKIKIDKKRALIYICSVIFIGLLFRLFGGSLIESTLSLLFAKSAYKDKVGYFSTTTNLGFLPYWFLGLCNLCIVEYSRRIINSASNSIVKEQRLAKLITIANLYALIMLPLITLNSNFYRLIRNMFILNMLLVCVANDKLMNKDNRREYYIQFIGLLIISAINRLPFMLGASQISGIIESLNP